MVVEAERKIKQATASEATRLGKHEAEDLDGTYDALALLFPRVQSLGHHLQGTPCQGWGSPEISEPGGLQKATGTYLSTPSLLLLTACPVTAPHFRFSFILPSGLERQWSWEETKLPVICTINHLLYRPPTPSSAPSPTHSHSCHPRCGPGLSGALRFVFAFFGSIFFLKPTQFIGHSARIQCYVELGISPARGPTAGSLTPRPAAKDAARTVGPPTTGHSAPDPCGGSRDQLLAPPSHLSLPISVEKRFSKPI